MPRMRVVKVVRPSTSTLQPRVPQASSTTNDRPYFPDPSTLVPPQKPPEESPPDTGKGTLAKTVLGYALLAIAVVIVCCLTIRRLSRLKRTNQPIGNFFSRSNTSGPTSTPQRSFPRTTGLPSLSSLPFYPTAMYDPHHRRIRGQDTDAHGRRLGATGGEYDYNHDDKDLLPAYDTAGGPPKYIDVELDFLGTSRTSGGRPIGGAGIGTGVRQSAEPDMRSETRRHRGLGVGSSPPSADGPGLLVGPPPMIGDPPPSRMTMRTMTTADSGTGVTLTTTSSPMEEPTTSGDGDSDDYKPDKN